MDFPAFIEKLHYLIKPIMFSIFKLLAPIENRGLAVLSIMISILRFFNCFIQELSNIFDINWTRYGYQIFRNY